MKKFSIKVAVAVILTAATTALPIFGAKNKSVFSELPACYDGSMSGVNLEGPFFVIPDSLSVVSCGYMSRHGARYLSSEKKVKGLEKGIDEARKAGTLTARGERFAELVATVRKASEGHWGLLSKEGIHEQEVFGKAFAANIIERFRLPEGHAVEQNAVSSYVPRVVETMYGFTCNTLIDNFVDFNSKPLTTINTSEGPEYDDLTRFFISNPTYNSYIHHGEWKGVYDDFVKDRISGDAARVLLGDIPGKDAEWYRKYSMEIYGMLMSLRVTGLGAPTTEWMSEGEYKACWEAANLDMYLKRTLNSVSDEACRAAVPLLGYLLQVDRGEIVEVFGHAETLIPLVAVMGLPSGVALVKDYEEVAAKWKNYEVAPLGSNIAIVTLENEKATEKYMMVFHNGLAVSPMPESGIVVKAEDYLDFLTNRITSFSSGARNN